MIPASIKIELYDCKDNLDLEELATALQMFLITYEETECAKGKIIVKIPGQEHWRYIKEN